MILYFLTGDIEFNSALEIDGNIIVAGDVDGVDVSDLAADAMLINASQTIQGKT